MQNVDFYKQEKAPQASEVETKIGSSKSSALVCEVAPNKAQ